jgi:probable F420-dependent oxidoreductase
MTRVAAEVADGLLVHGFTTRSYLREVTIPALTAGLTQSGRSREAFEIKYSPFVVTGADEREMARSAATARERIAFYASTPAYRPVLEHHGWGDLQTELNIKARKGEWQAMGELIDDEVLAAFAITVPSAEVPRALGHWVHGLADRTSLPPGPGVSPEETSEMVTAVREAGSFG